MNKNAIKTDKHNLTVSAKVDLEHVPYINMKIFTISTQILITLMPILTQSYRPILKNEVKNVIFKPEDCM
jgi:hypothetical protein